MSVPFYTSCKNQSIYILKLCDVQDQQECKSLNLAVSVTPHITGLLSMIAVTIIIVRYFLTAPGKRKTYDRLMLGMSCMNFFGALAFFLGQWPIWKHGPTPFCTFQSFLITLNQCVEWYIGALATNFFLRIVLRKSEHSVEKIEPAMHAVAWFLPVVFSLSVVGLDITGSAGLWCWIGGQYDWARWAFFYAWIWALMLYTTICMSCIVKAVYASDKRTIHTRTSVLLPNMSPMSGSALSSSPSPQSDQSKLARATSLRIATKSRQVAVQGMLYIACFLITWLFGTMNRIQNATVHTTEFPCSNFALAWLTVFFVPLQGVLNTIVYLYPRIVKMEGTFWSRVFHVLLARDLLSSSSSFREPLKRVESEKKNKINVDDVNKGASNVTRKGFNLDSNTMLNSDTSNEKGRIQSAPIAAAGAARVGDDIVLQ